MGRLDDIVGKRCLLKVSGSYGSGTVDEYKVLEIAPSGTWIKLMNINGRKFWKAIMDVVLVEELLPLDRPKMDKGE
jgi:hypothetical protein